MQHDSAEMQIVKDESVLPISEYPGAFVHAQPGMSTQTVVVVDTSQMPNTFSSITLYWPAECFIDCAGKRRGR
jgi:hypothetical protein